MADRYVKLDDVISIIKDVNWNLGGLIQHLKEHCHTADVVPSDEVERLEQILNSYALQYGTVKDQQAVIDKAKTEVAKEIFEEIEGLFLKNKFRLICNRIEFAELKKKYEV